ncbi:MAG: hypothetical protein WC801_06700, partial [Patescibacteria group bacterium]
EKAFGAGFARYLDRVGIKSPVKVFHSFRKNIAQAMLTSFPNYSQHYIGHLPYSVHHNIYSGRQLPFTFYLEQLQTASYPFLAFSWFKYKKGEFMPYLKRKKIELAR